MTCSGTCTAGGCDVPHAAGRTGPDAIAGAGPYVYWPETSGGNVMRMATSGSAISTLASGQATPTSLTLAGGYAYWTNASGGEVMRVSEAGGTPTTIAVGQSAPGSVTVSSDGALWSTTAGNACAIQELAASPDAGVTQWTTDSCPVSALFAVGSNLYWSDGYAVNAADLSVWNTHLEIGYCQSPPCPIAISGGAFPTGVWANSSSATAVMAWTVGYSYSPWVVATGSTNP